MDAESLQQLSTETKTKNWAPSPTLNNIPIESPSKVLGFFDRFWKFLCCTQNRKPQGPDEFPVCDSK